MRQFKIKNQITVRSGLSTQLYFNELEKTKVLSRDEELELTLRIQNGDQAAETKLVESNLRFVVSVAKDYFPSAKNCPGLTLDDLISEGNLGLIKAAKKFDPSRGFKFISYAVWWIRQMIMASLNETSRMVRLPGNKKAQIDKLLKAQEHLCSFLEREPSDEEICDLIMEWESKKNSKNYPITIEQVRELRQQNLLHLSLQTHVRAGDSEDTSLIDYIEDSSMPKPDSIFDNIDNQVYIGRLLKCITSKERDIVSLSFGLNGEVPMTKEELGERYGLTRERVRQILEKAIKRMRLHSRIKEPKKARI